MEPSCRSILGMSPHGATLLDYISSKLRPAIDGRSNPGLHALGVPTNQCLLVLIEAKSISNCCSLVWEASSSFTEVEL